MSHTVIWIVDLDAAINEAMDMAARVKTWLIAQGIVSLVPCGTYPGIPLLSRGKAASKWDAYPETSWSEMCGLEIATERRVFHTGENGIDGFRCPTCGTVQHPDALPWSDAVGAWFLDEPNHSMACPACRASHSIVDWEFDRPWGFGNLAFGFWNWPISDRLLSELAVITGHRCRWVLERI